MNNKILIVDDELSICDLLKIELELEGYVCECAYDGNAALEMFKSFLPDLVLLDVMLPGLDGYEVCRELSGCNVPVIMLSAKSEITDKIQGLDIGADDYITKPFDTNELLARIKAHIRRYKLINKEKPKQQMYKNGELTVMPSSKSVYINSQAVKLTATEFEILMLFLKNKNIVFSRQDIANNLGITDFDEDTRAIDMHIQRLRRKLSGYTKTKIIETVFGMGYIMRDMDEAEI